MRKYLKFSFTLYFFTTFLNLAFADNTAELQTQLKQMQETQQQQIDKLNAQIQSQLKQMQSQLQSLIQKAYTQNQKQIQQVQATLQQQIKLVHEEVMQNKAPAP